MTRIQIIKDLIKSLKERQQEIYTSKYEVEDSYNKKVQEYFQELFSGVVEDVIIESSRSTILFKRLNQEGTYNKELFTVYLKENFAYKEDEDTFKDVYLNYYTTYADSDYELSRLELLGKVAGFIKNSKDSILVNTNKLSKELNQILKEKAYYKSITEFDKQILKLRSNISEIEKEEIASKIFSEEGIQFSKGISIGLKFNYTPKVTSIKLIDVSKSGKKATAVFEFAHGKHTSREENVNVEKVISQINFCYKDIVQSVLAE